ncbi:MAG: hypothetical protein RSE13_01540 [Planktothrix sp. GU0601_MAG3]|nr:MAG: hypothetical protein RSE13_01540 [Planktothrix sp. GU0601_MAG3]
MSGKIFLLADETQRETLVDFVTQHANILSHYHLVGLDSIATALTQKTWLKVETVLPLRQGGDIAIASKITTGEEIIAVIYLVESTQTHLYEFPLLNLLRVCNIYNIPIATNIGNRRSNCCTTAANSFGPFNF